MPTFQGLGVHPKLQTCLVTTSTTTATTRAGTSSASSSLSPVRSLTPNRLLDTRGNAESSTNDNSGGDSSLASATPSWLSLGVVPVPSPHALLARPLESFRLLETNEKNGDSGNRGGEEQPPQEQASHPGRDEEEMPASGVVVTPAASSRVLPISMTNVIRLRYDVAQAIVVDSHDGRYAQEVVKDPDSDNNNKTASLAAQNNSGCKSGSCRSFPLKGFISAHDWERQETTARRASELFFTTGCTSLDQMMSIPPSSESTQQTAAFTNDGCSRPPWGYIVQVSGPPASGKTQVLLSLVASLRTTVTTPLPPPAHAASGPPPLVWYLCSSSNPLATHLTRLAELVMMRNPNGNQHAQILSRIVPRTIHSERELVSTLVHIEEHLCEERTKRLRNTTEIPHEGTLVIVDSLSDFFVGATANGPPRGGGGAVEGLPTLETMGRYLRHLARRHRVAVFVASSRSTTVPRTPTTNAGSGSTDAVELRLRPDFHISLTPRRRPEEAGPSTNLVVEARLQRHPFLDLHKHATPIPDSAVFTVQASGVQSMG